MNEEDGNMIERMAGLRRYQLLLAPLFIYTQRMDELMDETMAFKDYGTVGAGGLRFANYHNSFLLYFSFRLSSCCVAMCANVVSF